MATAEARAVEGHEQGTPATHWGGSAAAIQHHYDVSNEFYKLWLDPSMTYSCALWDGRQDRSSLVDAQIKKLDYHAKAAEAVAGGTMLDIGCGWGSMISHLMANNLADRCVGLTLSKQQAAYVREKRLPGVEIREESWTDHKPEQRYDGIISVGAFEHFASYEHSQAEKLGIYRDFFRHCAQWLKPRGKLSLQTIAYGTLDPQNADKFMQQEIFPDAEIPILHEIVNACHSTFEVVRVRNDRFDYMRTCEAWLSALRARRTEAVAMVGDETVQRYERYLKLSSAGFMLGKIQLLRLELRAHV